MIIIVDKEAKAILEKICDIALKNPNAGGMGAYTHIKRLENALQLEEVPVNTNQVKKDDKISD